MGTPFRPQSMTAPSTQRALRLGGLLFLGAALLAAAALGLDWRFAPTGLRAPWVEMTLLAAGIVALFLALLVLVLDPLPDPWGRAPPVPRTSHAGASLMALPALVTSDGSDDVGAPAHTGTPSSASPPPPLPTAAPVGLAAAATSGSTLLIPFAAEAGPSSSTLAPTPQTVTGLVGRMDALQRATPLPPPTPPRSTRAPAEPGPVTLLQRLSQIPTPRGTGLPSSPGRRCADCGESLGSPPRFEACGDCGRALCARCYWKTSSGPQAHLCATCVQNHSVPRPPTPAVSFGRPTAAAGPTPPPRSIQPRRPVN